MPKNECIEPTFENLVDGREHQLTRAGIPLVELAASEDEMASTVLVGMLGDLIVTRPNGHWLAEGIVPDGVVLQLGEDPFNRSIIRPCYEDGTPLPRNESSTHYTRIDTSQGLEIFARAVRGAIDTSQQLALPYAA